MGVSLSWRKTVALPGAAMLLMLLASTTLCAQSGAVVLTGRIRSTPETPLQGLLVSVALDEREPHVVAVSPAGDYRTTLMPGTRTVSIRVTSVRFQPVGTTVMVPPGAQEVRAPDMVLVLKAQIMPEVRAVAPRSLPAREEGPPAPGPGGRSLNLDPTFAATGDLTGDPAYAVAALVGVQVTASRADGSPQVSIAGLDPMHNRATLNGSVASGTPPRDGAILQVLLRTYDPGQGAGGLATNWSLLSGSVTPTQRVHATLSTPQTEWVSSFGRDVGSKSASPTISGNFAGRAPFLVRFFNASFQFSARRATVPSILSASTLAASELGYPAGAIDRLRAGLPALGIDVSGVRGLIRESKHASLYARLDLTGNAIATSTPGLDGTLSAAGPGRGGDVAYLVVGGSLASSRMPGAAATSLQFDGANNGRASGVLQAVWSHFSSAALTESRIAFSTTSSRSEPASHLPGASVLFATEDGVDAASAALAELGGSGGQMRESNAVLLHAMNETRVKSRDNRHEYKVSLESGIEYLRTARASGAGNFAFQSLSDYLNNAPTSFTRRIEGRESHHFAQRTVVGIGDSYHPTRMFSVQYGIRLEHELLRADTRQSGAVDAILGRDSRRLPSWIGASPMAGFTWILQRDAYGFPNASRRISGGIREYRTSLPLAFVAQSPHGGSEVENVLLRCIGASVPRPNWSAYLAGLVPPGQCGAEGASAGLSQGAPEARLFATDFSAGRSLRGELALDYSLPGSMHATVHGMLARNSSMTLPSDINFSGIVREQLESEGKRPLFVPRTDFVTQSGAASYLASRRFPQLGIIQELRSDGIGEALTVGVTLAHRPAYSFYSNGIRTPVALDYTYSDIRTQANGFVASTDGDPRKREWQNGGFSRHTVLVSGALRLPDVGTATLGVQIRSGAGYTPLVGSDINGDGFANDRAFVFDTTVGSNPFVNGMPELLGKLPLRTRSCLLSQIGRVAGAQTCQGSRSVVANAALTIDPYRLRLQNRGTVRIVLTNVAAGMDMLLHRGKPQGWGQPAYDDPVLYLVRGFDTTAARFRYAVNPQFGSATAMRAAHPNPFRVSLDVTLEIGRSQERRMMEQRLAARAEGIPLTRKEIAERLAWQGPALFERLLSLRDSIALTSLQADTLSEWSRRHSAFRDSVYAGLAGFLEGQHGVYASKDVQQRWHDAIAAVRWHEWHFREPLRRLLTRTQSEAVFSERAPAVPRLLLMDRKEATRFLDRWYLGPA